MQNNTYIERATKIVLDSGIAVTALLSADDALVVFWPLLTTPPEEFAGMIVRSMGCLGRAGEQTDVALKEPLDSTVFDSYWNTVNSLEISELERLYALSDTRL